MKILDTGIASAARNMEIDADLLRRIEPGAEPILHLYDWQGKCATYGHFADPDALLLPGAAERHQITLARRPTGGGMLFHWCDFAFSLVLPITCPGLSTNTLKNYESINSWVARVIGETSGGAIHLSSYRENNCGEKPTFCMASPTCYDLLLDGKKVVGSAQRRTKQGLLHQGSICLAFPEQLECLVPGDLSKAMRDCSLPIGVSRADLYHFFSIAFKSFEL